MDNSYAVNVRFESLSQRVLLIQFMPRNSKNSFPQLLPSPSNCLMLVLGEEPHGLISFRKFVNLTGLSIFSSRFLPRVPVHSFLHEELSAVS